MYYRTGLDITNIKQMWTFLKNHFTYYTMNSWNGLSSIANNVKLYNLKLEGSWTTALSFLLDEKDIGDLQWQLDELRREFAYAHPGYEVHFNGRSGGYLVLHNENNNKTVLPDCVAGYDTYEDFKADCQYFGYKLTDYFWDLRNTAILVRDFDKLCDEMRDMVNEYSKMDYKEQVLAYNINEFNEHYEEDLNKLKISPLVIIDGEVDVTEASYCLCLYEALLKIFQTSNITVQVENNRLSIWEV